LRSAFSVFGAQWGVEAEGHLKFVKAVRGQRADQYLVQAFEGVVYRLSRGRIFDRKAGLQWRRSWADAGQPGRIAR